MECQTTVELRIKCTNLVNKDLLSKSDPYVNVFMKHPSGSWNQIAKTETLNDDLNPTFARPIIVDYLFEMVQELKFIVSDKDVHSEEMLGQCEAHLGQIVAAIDGVYTCKLNNSKNVPVGKSSISITASDMSKCKEKANMVLYGKNLDKKDFLGKSDPYLEIYQIDDVTGKSLLVHRTEVVMNTLNPRWKQFSLPVARMDNLKLMCYDWDNDGSHDFIGEAVTNLKQLEPGIEIQLINKKKQSKKRKYKNSGCLFVQSNNREIHYTFLDFITNGCQLNFTVGIDFTLSNGDSKYPTSLHYQFSGPSQYERAIQSVGSVLQDYDSDQMFPSFGFGAKTGMVPNVTSHEFALNGCPTNPYCAGVRGIIEAYRSSVAHVTLHGPTYFAPIISQVTRFANAASKSGKSDHYFVLLMLTDGIITDMDKTVECIVEASHYPMSIIIVGIGDADFTNMDKLDGDNGMLRNARGSPAARDIVQFVPINKFRGCDSELAREVLAEIPSQVVGYYRHKGIMPLDRTRILPQ